MQQKSKIVLKKCSNRPQIFQYESFSSLITASESGCDGWGCVGGSEFEKILSITVATPLPPYTLNKNEEKQQH